jgi:N-acetylglucosamine-6-phosphate deacetylase
VQATRQTATVPARVLGRSDIGDLEPGMRADFVVLDPHLRVTRVVVGGVEVDAADEPGAENTR